MFEPLKDGVSDIGCRITQTAWVALYAETMSSTAQVGNSGPTHGKGESIFSHPKRPNWFSDH